MIYRIEEGGALRYGVNWSSANNTLVEVIFAVPIVVGVITFGFRIRAAHIRGSRLVMRWPQWSSRRRACSGSPNTV